MRRSSRKREDWDRIQAEDKSPRRRKVGIGEGNVGGVSRRQERDDEEEEGKKGGKGKEKEELMSRLLPDVQTREGEGVGARGGERERERKQRKTSLGRSRKMGRRTCEEDEQQEERRSWWRG